MIRAVQFLIRLVVLCSVCAMFPTVAVAERIPRNVFCKAENVAKTILESHTFDFVCDKFPGLWSEACKKGNPYPSPEDFWNFCVDCVLTEAGGGKPCPKFWGDTHVTTIDGIRYTFQAQGDYAAIQSDELEVQIRLEGRGVSYIDGVALKHGGVTISIDDSSDPDAPVHVAGISTQLESGDWRTFGSDGGYLQRIGDAYLIKIPGMITIGIRRSALYLNFERSLRGDVEGLSGDGDGDPANDLRTPNGEPVIASDHQSLYGEFMEGWRREGEASLFATPFEYDGDPNDIRNQVKRLADLPQEDRMAAEAKCLGAGVERGAGLDECIYDLAITGDDRFLQDAVSGQDVLDGTISAVALSSEDVEAFTIRPEGSISKDEPAEGAGSIGRRFNIDRYRFDEALPEATAIVLTAPCNRAASLALLERTGEKVLREQFLSCSSLTHLDPDTTAIDVYSPGGDILDYRFEIKSGLDEATLTGPHSAEAGETVLIAWTGPANTGDFVSIAKPDARGDKAETFKRVDGIDGADVALRVPGIPGVYEIRYVLSSDRVVLARQKVEVVPAKASISAPARIEAGTELTVAWTGPANTGDFISIAKPDVRGDKAETSKRVDGIDGANVILRVPDVPGIYELRYVLSSDRQIIARQAITVE